MASLDDVLSLVAEYVADDKDKARTKELAQALLKRDETNSVAQALVNRGRAKGSQAEVARVAELEEEAKRAKDEAAELKRENDDLRSKEPNWQRRLEENDRKWEGKVKAAQEQAQTERQARMSEKVETARQRFMSAVSPHVRDAYRKQVLPVAAADRFVPSDDGTSVKVLELGKTTFYDPEDGDPAEQLARDYLEKVDPEFRLMGVPDAGAGTRGNGTVDKAIAQIADQKARTGMYQL